MASLIAAAFLALGGCVLGAESARTTSEGRWDRQNIQALIGAVDDLAVDGLFPADYDLEALRSAVQTGSEVKTHAVASAIFKQVATHLVQGVAPQNRQTRWAIDGAVADPQAIDDAMEAALRQRRVADALSDFAPDHPQYALLKAALVNADATDQETAARLRLNMERWRWMPRDLGPDYILVNVPGFEAILVRDGKMLDRRRVIVGAPKTPTPQFEGAVTGVTFNPTWRVPASIVKESVGALLEGDPDAASKQGYYVADDGGVRQRPGPQNALGRMKLEMPNPYSVFLHDTPAKALFDRESRALSHGCIRVEGAVDFARMILKPAWDDETIGDVLSTESTVTVALETPVPVYVTYFTAVAEADGSITYYSDIYGRDRSLLSDLNESQRSGSLRPDARVAQGCATTSS